MSYSYRDFVVCPPMYRTTPLWYLDGLSEILLQFSAIMDAERPRNLLLLGSFPNPELESDGVHLTPYSGYQYVLHLFDKTCDLIRSQKQTPEAFVISHTESLRSLEDRVVVLEKDHQRLNKVILTFISYYVSCPGFFILPSALLWSL